MVLDISSFEKPSGTRQPRNWPEYNEHLIKRGEILLYFEHLESWEEELKQMNRNKRGRPFKFPNSLIFVAKMLRFQYSIRYRQLEGFLRSLGQLLDFEVPSYSTLFKRLPEIDLTEYLPLDPPGNQLVLAIDSSGIKIDNYGDWMRHKWKDKAKSRRGWIKLHIIADTKSHRVLDFRITRDDVGDQPMFIPLVRACVVDGQDIERVLADGIYDTKMIHNYLAYLGIRPGIPPRKNASRKSGGSPARAVEVRFWDDYGEEIWKLTRQYHKRPAVERVFGAFKQVFGEKVMSKKWDRILDELRSKLRIYNWNLSGDRGLA